MKLTRKDRSEQKALKKEVSTYKNTRRALVECFEEVETDDKQIAVEIHVTKYVTEKCRNFYGHWPRKEITVSPQREDSTNVVKYNLTKNQVSEFYDNFYRLEASFEDLRWKQTSKEIPGTMGESNTPGYYTSNGTYHYFFEEYCYTFNVYLAETGEWISGDSHLLSFFEEEDHSILFNWDYRGHRTVTPLTNGEEVLQYHGIAAYSGSSNFKEKLSACLEQDIIICGSDRAIGPVGILFKGPVYRAYESDVWSSPEERNRVDRSKSVSRSSFRKLSVSLIGSRDYIETYTQVSWVYAMWIDKESIPLHIYEEALETASEFGLDVIEIRPSRIGKDKVEQEFGPLA